MQGPLRGIHQDLYKSFSQGLHKRSWNLEAGPCTPELRPAFCVSLRNRNAHGHAHKSQLLCENLQQKCRGPMEHPDVTPALTPTVKAPAVWTHRRASPRSESTWASPPIDPREKSPAGKGRARELDTFAMENDPFIDLIYFADLIAYNRIYTYMYIYTHIYACMHTCRIIPCIYTYSVGYNRIRIRTRLGYKRTYNQINGGFPLRYGNSKGTFCDKPIIYVDDLPINWFVINTY